MRISDWSSDVCSSDLIDEIADDDVAGLAAKERRWLKLQHSDEQGRAQLAADAWCAAFVAPKSIGAAEITTTFVRQAAERPSSSLDASKRSEEHTSELQSIMRISSAVFCLKKTKNITNKSLH